MGAIPPAKNWITGKVNGISQRILIDSGATVGVVTPEVAAATDYKTKAGRRVSLHGPIRGDRETIMVKYEFGNSSFEKEAAVSESSEDFQGIIFPWDISNRAESQTIIPLFEGQEEKEICVVTRRQKQKEKAQKLQEAKSIPATPLMTSLDNDSRATTPAATDSPDTVGISTVTPATEETQLLVT